MCCALVAHQEMTSQIIERAHCSGAMHCAINRAATEGAEI